MPYHANYNIAVTLFTQLCFA